MQAALDGARLVTLTGAGGCGKTRLAVQAAAQREHAHPDGIWFADLSLVVDDESVEAAVREVGTVADLVSGIGTRAVLLVLDNCEHVVDGAATLVDRLLRACPAFTVLATSREPLGVAGEVVYRVPSLPPEDAQALFVDRAGRDVRDRTPTEDAAVADICDRLDGIPLAIEFAAARMRVLSAAQIRDGLQDRFRLLTGGTRTSVPRQQTLQASVDWSHDLLTDGERVVLRRLSVFAGPFSIAAAEAVASDGLVERHDVLDLVVQLVEKSLLTSEGERLRLLETVRQYAATKLLEAGEAEETWRRLYDWALAFARRRRSDETDEEYRLRLAADYENLRRALQWSADLEDPMALASLCLSLHVYWSSSRRLREGANWFERAAERSLAIDPAVRAMVLRSYPYLRGLAGDWIGAYEPSCQAVEMARELGDRSNLMWALLQHETIHRNVTQPSVEFVAEALDIAAELGDEQGRAFGLFLLGFGCARDEAKADRAIAYATEALEIAARIGVPQIRRYAAGLVAVAMTVRGEITAAIAPLEAAAADLRAAGEGFFLGQVLAALTMVHSSTGDDAAARVLQRELHELTLESNDPSVQQNELIGRMSMAWQGARWEEGLQVTGSFDFAAGSSNGGFVLGQRAVFLALAGRHAEAAEVAVELERFDTVHGWGLPAPAVRGIVALLAGDLDRAEERLTVGVERLTERDVTANNRMLMLTALAATMAARGRFDDAARLVGAADAYGRAVGMGPAMADVFPFRADAIERIGPALGERFETLYAEGLGLDRDATVTWLLRGRGSRKRPATGWASLTRTERQVVELVAEGLTNKEIAARLFVGAATVKSHLTHVFTKTGHATRAQLAAEWVRQSPTPTEDRSHL